jgi:Osmosensitive K+ channel His kinase sensor domain
VLVDELAHATADRTRQRWQDVADVLRAGHDVVTTVNVAHLRSVRDYAARITGVGSVSCVPDEFVRSGEVVLVDMPAEALRQRIAAGADYSAGQVSGALADYFRAANLRALSELARAEDAQLLVVHVQISDGLAHPPAGDLDRHRELTADLGGTYTQIQGHAPAEALSECRPSPGHSHRGCRAPPIPMRAVTCCRGPDGKRRLEMRSRSADWFSRCSPTDPRLTGPWAGVVRRATRVYINSQRRAARRGEVEPLDVIGRIRAQP